MFETLSDIGAANGISKLGTKFSEQLLSLGDMVTLSPHSTFLVRSDSYYPEAAIV